METSLFTVKIGPTVFGCPKCRTLLEHYCQPVNVHVYACPACKKVYDPVYVRGFEDGLAAHAAQHSVKRTPLECAHENATPSLPGFKECHDCGMTVRR